MRIAGLLAVVFASQLAASEFHGVVRECGKPVAGAELSLSRKLGAAARFTAKSDDDGSYRLTIPDDADDFVMDLSVERGRFTDRRRVTRGESEHAVDWEWCETGDPEGILVYGFMRDCKGAPLPGAVIKIRWDHGHRGVEAGLRGEYLRRIPAWVTNFEIYVTMDGYSPSLNSVKVDGRKRIRWDGLFAAADDCMPGRPPARQVVGVVTGCDGQPAADVFLFPLFTLSDETGRFTAEIETQSRRLTVTPYRPGADGIPVTLTLGRFRHQLPPIRYCPQSPEKH